MAKNTMYLYGKNSVLERLKANPASISRIYLQDNYKSQYVLDIIESAARPVKQVSEKELLKIKRADRAQGIIAEVTSYEYMPFEELVANALASKSTIVFLDNINDPHNFGSMIRTLACFGNFCIVIPKHSSCEVNDTVVHVASGGENYVAVSMVNNSTTALLKAKEKGFWIAGTVVDGGEDITKTSLPFPLCLVLGSEGKGIRHGIQKHLDLLLTLPMKGAKLSLNVATACSVFAYEITRQQEK